MSPSGAMFGHEGRFHFPTLLPRAYPRGMEDDPDHQELARVMAIGIAGPMAVYAIMQLIFTLT